MNFDLYDWNELFGIKEEDRNLTKVEMDDLDYLK